VKSVHHDPDSRTITRSPVTRKEGLCLIGSELADGSPQVTPIWFDWDGTHIMLNTARGRVKDKVMHRGGKVALLIVDPADPIAICKFADGWWTKRKRALLTSSAI